MKQIHFISLFGIASLTFSCDNNATRLVNKPNVLFLLIDDMGWKDLECFGAEVYETPNIDALATQGTKFTNAYTSVSICAPARATALTGYHPAKLGMWNHYHHLPDNPLTIAQLLKDQGYATWHVGKWHCGSPDNNTLPTDVGFDVNIGGGISWAPGNYFWPYSRKQENPRMDVPGLKEISKKGDYVTDVLTDQAIKLIKERDVEKPFYLNFWHYAVHGPWQAKTEMIEKYEKKIREGGYKDNGGRYDPPTDCTLVTSYTGKKVAIYAAMIESVDQSVGRVIQTLKDENIYDNTLIVFYSDNGPTTHLFPCVPLNGGKNSTYEAGVRVPAFFTWKGRIPEGRISNEPINIADVPVTILDLATKTQFPENKDGLEGISLRNVLQGEKVEKREFIWYFPDTRLHWAQRANAAILGKNGFKYIMFFNGDEDELYDINNDYAETNNIIDQYPGKVNVLKKHLVDYLKKYYSRMPPPPEEYIDLVEERLGVSSVKEQL